MRLALPTEPTSNRPWTGIVKRDGTQVPFDAERIRFAVARAGQASGEFAHAVAQRITADVLDVLTNRFPAIPPTIEDIQDEVERALMRAGQFRAARIRGALISIGE